MIGKIIRISCQVLLVVALATTFTLFYLYKPLEEGTIYLRNAPSKVSITREESTSIAHIEADNSESIMYGMGYAAAQTRLWQMERSRRVVNGKLSEIFGDLALNMDKFSLIVGYKRLAEETMAALAPREVNYLQKYADGVNDFVASVGLIGESSANLLPPEFYIFGID